MNCNCPPLKKRVINVNSTADPVVLTIEGTITEIAQNHCFTLEICPDILTSDNVNPVVITDSTGTIYVFEQGFTGNVIHYDQLIRAAERHKCGKLCLFCFYGNDGPAGSVLHITCNTKLPCTKFIPAPPPTTTTP